MASIKPTSSLFTAVACGVSFKAGGFANEQQVSAAAVDLIQEVIIPPANSITVEQTQTSAGGEYGGDGGVGCGGGGM